MTNYKILSLNINEDSKKTPVLFDHYSISHFLFGYVGILTLNYFKINQVYSVLLLFIIHTVYEIKDYYYSYIYKGKPNFFTKKSGGNSISNCIGDSIVFILGVILAINTNYSRNTVIIINILHILLTPIIMYPAFID